MVAMSEEGAALTPDGMRPAIMDPTLDVVMGHEFCAEVVELGANTGNSPSATSVVSIPIVFDPSGIHPIGYSNALPGGYGERMVLSDMLAIKVPNGLDPASGRAHRADGGRPARREQVGDQDKARPRSCSGAGRSAWR